MCGIMYTAAGTPVTAQIPGDCHVIVCDGNGGTKSPNPIDSSDVPSTGGNLCQKGTCTLGIPKIVNVTDGILCQTVNVCIKGSCTPATCTDGFQDGAETDKDCGGVTCSKCPDGKNCTINFDCSSNVCDTSTNKCNASSCNDGKRNGGESDVDCGGTVCVKCGPGSLCNVGMTDCMSMICVNGTCM